VLHYVRAMAVGLPFGLFMTVVGGGELFTGNTAMVTAAVLEKRATLKGLLKVCDMLIISQLSKCPDDSSRAMLSSL
jgi:formate/nitrite transporter FocA (FNT family)